jgi:hypothetical protein
MEPRDLDAYLDATADALGLTVAPEDRAAVRAQLAALFAAAELVMEFPLPDEIEPAPVFRA